MKEVLFGKRFITYCWSILIIFVVLTSSTSMSEIFNKNINNQTGVFNNSISMPSLVKRVANWEKIAIYSILFIGWFIDKYHDVSIFTLIFLLLSLLLLLFNIFNSVFYNLLFFLSLRLLFFFDLYNHFYLSMMGFKI